MIDKFDPPKGIDDPIGIPESVKGVRNRMLEIDSDEPKKRGCYTPARIIEIKSIPTAIVDPHGEVLPIWLEVPNGPALLIHIDNHADMDQGVPTLEQAKQEYANIQNYSDYAKYCLRIANFICVAIHEKIIGSVFWYDPRNDYVESYGRIQSGAFIGQPTTVTNRRGRIRWRSNKSEKISINDAQQDISSFNGPMILDIDLDSFLCIKDPSGQDPNVMFERLGKFKSFIQLLGKKPDAISIARSQTPTLWTPAEKVDEIEREVIKILAEVF